MQSLVEQPQSRVGVGIGDIRRWIDIARLTGDFGEPRHANHCPLAKMFYTLYNASDVLVDEDYISAIGPGPDYDWLYHERNEGTLGTFIKIVDACPTRLTYEYIRAATDAAAATEYLQH